MLAVMPRDHVERIEAAPPGTGNAVANAVVIKERAGWQPFAIGFSRQPPPPSNAAAARRPPLGALPPRGAPLLPPAAPVSGPQPRPEQHGVRGHL